MLVVDTRAPLANVRSRVAPVPLTGPQGEGKFGGVTDQLLASIAKEPFGLGIYKDDPLVGIDHDHILSGAESSGLWDSSTVHGSPGPSRPMGPPIACLSLFLFIPLPSRRKAQGLPRVA